NFQFPNKNIIFSKFLKNEILENVENCNEKQFHYISAPSGLFAVFTKETGQTDKLQYIHTDHLGSIQTISNESGQIEATYSYDAWGRQRDATNWFLYYTTPLQAFNRGYTGHEHLSDFGLINLNGRLYDPVLGRMLSPDNYVQMAGNSQNYNRYSYAHNNPLIYTDPNGENPFFVMAAGMILWSGGKVMSDYASMGRIEQGWGTVGSILQVVGGVMMTYHMNAAFSEILPAEQIGNSAFEFGITPHFSMGTDGIGLGVNSTLVRNLGNGFNTGVNLGLTYYASAPGTGESGFEGRLGYGFGYKDNPFKNSNRNFWKNLTIQGGIGSTYFLSGETSQLSGQVYAGGGKWKLTYENDTWAPVPGLWDFNGATSDRDKFRTAALSIDITGGKLKGANAGLLLFTGQPSGVSRNGTFIGPGANKYRLGAVYGGYNNFRVGYNSEKNIRGPVQNGFHDIFDYSHFKVLNIADRFYGGYYTSNPYTLW
ncbi:MAG: hypothetical protein HN704_03275, partial [Bacteroidetes bacterium]|nr:hypothetical protein [Bacteroidota bacterium]